MRAEPGGIYSSYLKSPGESPARWAAARSCTVAGAGVRGRGDGLGLGTECTVQEAGPTASPASAFLERERALPPEQLRQKVTLT